MVEDAVHEIAVIDVVVFGFAVDEEAALEATGTRRRHVDGAQGGLGKKTVMQSR